VCVVLCCRHCLFFFEFLKVNLISTTDVDRWRRRDLQYDPYRSRTCHCSKYEYAYYDACIDGHQNVSSVMTNCGN